MSAPLTIEIKDNNKVKKPDFVRASTQKMRAELFYNEVINGQTKISYATEKDNDLELKTLEHVTALEMYVNEHEPIRTYLAGKKLKGTTLSKIEQMVLNSLNEKLDKLLNEPVTEFQKLNRELIAEAKRLVRFSK